MKQFDKIEDFHGYTGLVLFSAPWCQPCKSYKPALAQIANQAELELAHVDIDAQRMLGATFGIRAVPTTAWFSDGKLVRSKSGAQTVNGIMTIVAGS
jgi:thioredoxin-like negative regulator of GroEL